MTKILILIKNAHNYSGTEKMANFMTEVYGANNIVDILSLEGKDDEECFYEFKNIHRIHHVSDKKSKILYLINFINKGKYDFIFVISMGKLSVIFRLISFFLKTSHTKYISCEHISLDSFKPIIKKIKVLALKWFDKVVVLTDRDEEYLKSNGVNAEKISNPIDFKFYNRQGKTKNILAVGRLEYQKGFDELLLIWKNFSIKNPGYKLNIAGDGILRDKLIANVDELKINDSVKFLGKLTNMDNAYINSDILVMTSRYEGLPLALLEAKSWSMPIVAFNCPTGPKEIVKNNVDGFLIENRSYEDFLFALEKLCSDDNLYFKFSSATFNTYKEFDKNAITQKWIELIRY